MRQQVTGRVISRVIGENKVTILQRWEWGEGTSWGVAGRCAFQTGMTGVQVGCAQGGSWPVRVRSPREERRAGLSENFGSGCPLSIVLQSLINAYQ